MKGNTLNILTAIAASALALNAGARDASGLKVYINPGHGGHDADDRNVVIAPYAQGDPNGYWESNSNLSKGLQLRDMLEAKGYTVVMSRVTNTSADDLALSTIVRLSNESKSDIFFSIHSNATGTESRRNFPLMLFRGYDNQPVKAKDKEVATILNKYLLQNQATYWTSTNTNVRGDFDFYPSWNGAGLGVLRGNNVTGMLSEGSFHDYVPEAYRLMSDDFCWLEAWHFRKCIDEFFGVDGIDKGAVAGRLNDSRLPREGQYVKFGDDKFATIQNATVELLDESGKVVGTYVTDGVHLNGFYLFKDVEPGNYTVRAKVDTHYDVEEAVTVTADEITFCNMQMSRVRSTPPVVEGYGPVWNEGDEGVLCNTPITLEFNWDMDTEATEKAFSIDPPVEGVFTWEDLNYRLVFTPTTPYNISTTYTVTLNTDAKHPGDLNLQEPFSFKFVTSSRNYMSILGSFPKQDDEVHFDGATIEFRFDKNPNTTPILNQVTCTDSQGNPVAFNKRKMSASNSKSAYGFFRIPFQNPLTVGETYHLKVSGDFADKDGITIQKPVDITFTAVDAATTKDGYALIDNMSESTYAYDAEGSSQVTTASAAKSTSETLFDSSMGFTYTFDTNDGGEVRWGRSEAAETVINPNDPLSVHLYGDLTGNSVYLELTSDVSTRYLHIADMDFLGWRHFDLKADVAEAPSQLTGVKLVQKESQMSHTGTFRIDRIDGQDAAGVEDAYISGVSVYPNPASEYLIANAGNTIEKVELYDLNGRMVAASAGNVLNVSDISAGNYIFVVTIYGSRSVHKVAVKH